MKRKIYSLHITDFSGIGGRHFYGSIKDDYNCKQIKELERPDPIQPLWLEPDEPPFMTIRFDTEMDVVNAARIWFRQAQEIPEGSLLAVWKGHFSPEEIEQIKSKRRESLST